MCGKVFKKIKKVFKKAAPALAGFALGGPLGGAIGGSLGLGATASSLLGGALVGAGTGALTGQGPLMGALGGAAGGYMGLPGAAGAGAGTPLISAGSSALDTLNAVASGTLSPTTAGYLNPGAFASAVSPAVAGVAKTAAGLGPLIPAAANIGTGILGLQKADQLQQAAVQADPMAPYRSQYAQQLQQLQEDPSQVQNIPGYQAGLDAVMRSLASQGYTGSGNMMAALQDYGGQFYQQQFQNLSNLAGVNISPAVSLQGQQGAANLYGDALSRFGYAAGSLMGQQQQPGYANPWMLQ